MWNLVLVLKLYSFLIYVVMLGREEMHSYLDCFNIFLFVAEQIMMLWKLHKTVVKIPDLLSATILSYITFHHSPFSIL